MATTESPMDQVSTPAPSAKATKAAALEPTKAPTDAPTKAPTPGPTTAPPTMAPVTSSPTKVSILDGTSFTAETLKAELFAQQTNDKAKATEKAAPKASSVVTGEIVRPNILEQPFKDAIASGEEHHDQPIIDIPDIPHAPEPEPIIPIIAAGAGPLTSMHTASSVCAKSQADALRQCKTLPICKYESLGFGKDLIIQEYILGGQPDCVQRCDSKFGHGLDVTHCDDDEECFNFIFGCECPSLQHTGKCKPY